jgi:hypothetical protein
VHDSSDLDSQLQAPGYVADPYPVYARLRDEAPVFWSHSQQQWLVSRLADCRTVLRDAATFSNFGWERGYLAQLPPETQEAIPSITAHATNPHLLISDGPLHDRLRAKFRPQFFPRSIDDLKPRISRMVAELLDALSDRDRIDVVSELAHPLPANVIAELYGAQVDDQARLRRWSRALTEFFGKPIPDADEAREVEELLTAFRGFLEDLIEQRRRAPANDLATLLGDDSWDAEMEPARLGTAVLLMVAGHTTTSNLIANAIKALLEHPEQLAHVRSVPGAISGAVEETLRWDPPVQRIRRVVMKDTELGGVTMRKGDRVAVLPGSANRDPDLCAQPDEYDVTRGPTLNVAFGSGMHFCIGNTLAKAQAEIAVADFLARFPHARIDEAWNPNWRPTLTSRSLGSLWVRVSA